MAHEPQASTHGAGHAKALPADLAAPAFVDGWKSRALIVGGISMCVALLLIFLANAQDHLGFDQRARVMVKIEGGKWKLETWGDIHHLVPLDTLDDQW